MTTVAGALSEIPTRQATGARRTAPPNPYRDRLVTRMRELAVANPRRGRGYIMNLLRKEGWSVGARVMKRLLRQKGLRVRQERVQRGCISTGENGIVRRRPPRKHEVWGMDFVQDRTADGRHFRRRVVVDEYTRGCLAIEVHRNLRGEGIMSVLVKLMAIRWVLAHLRADDRPEMI